MINQQSGLSKHTISLIQQVLAKFPDIISATLYGSRAKGTFKSGSDIDLTLHITENTAKHLLVRVLTELDDLDVIYGFDVSIFTDIDNPDLVEHIERVGLEIYNAEAYRKQQEQIKLQQQLSQQQEHKHLLDMPEQGYQSEAQLEQNLLERLSSGLGYSQVKIQNSEQLLVNLKQQLERHNNVELTEAEFAKVLSHLDKGNVFARAKTLRDRFYLPRDNGEDCYLQFLNTEHWCQNQYQVTSQVTQVGKYENRYDVTLLINGLPLVQIELKRRGIELKEAFNQINRYQRHSFWADTGLFNYVQLFVISNGVNTKYYANNRNQDFKQTFYWSDKNNNLITQLDGFADHFLEKCHVSKMISKYIVLHESDKILMVLRPYQYYAVEAIENRVKEGRKNGYIWHTTGSGKTLTSFKAAQILTRMPKVDKVLFVVDRADLDYQTTREFNHFSPDCVDGTDDTKALVKQMVDDNSPLIITTIQKLNTAITKSRHQQAMAPFKDQRVVFIFDECHRSQFGDTHNNIVNFFSKAQMFGFTGTPIFEANAASNQYGKRTTKNLFTECLHKYLITNAIADDNVLKFAVEYWGKLKRKDGSLIDEQVAAINRKEFFESDERLNGIVNWVILNHDRKTHNKQFSAIMCVSNVDTLLKYYQMFNSKKQAGEHDLRVVTCFSYGANKDDADANGEIPDPNFDISKEEPNNKHTREQLELCVADYNTMYNTKHSVKDSKAFYAYYKDIAKRMKERDKATFEDKDRADILLVVNMYLTGFDAKKLNTLYVDKNLKYHGLVQAYSRTNRILGELKSQGNIVCFRNLKDNTDEAIKLFCDDNPSEDILMEPYEFYVGQFNQGLEHMLALVPTPDSVNELQSEDAQLAFVQSFRQLVRSLNKLKPFADFDWCDLGLTEQTFEDYKSKYLDIFDRHKNAEEKVSILDEIDFELELIQRDEVNVAFILELLGQTEQHQGKYKPNPESMQPIMDMLGNEVQLRSKRELIEKFIQDYMPNIPTGQPLKEVFSGFWLHEKRKAVHQLCEQEQLDKEQVYQLIDAYTFTGKDPLREQVFAALAYKPKLMERKKLYQRILTGFKQIIEQFEDNTGAIGVNEDAQDYENNSLTMLSRRIGDARIFFNDELRYSRHITTLARFNIKLDRPYQHRLESLTHYDLGAELLGKGVINNDILTDYLALTAELSQYLIDSGVELYQGDNEKDGVIVWSLSEAREGSTVLEFVLNVWGYTAAIGGPVMAFLAAYPKASEGLEKLKSDLNQRFKRVNKDKAPMIITEDLEQELRNISSREQ